MTDFKVTLSQDGMVKIPKELRDELGWRTGDELPFRLESGTVSIRAIDAAIRHAQVMIREYVPEGRSLVDELIAERRQEAKRE